MDTINILEISKYRYRKLLLKQYAELEEAWGKEEWKKIREICHRISGSAKLFGFDEIGDYCGRVESANEQELEFRLKPLMEALSKEGEHSGSAY